MARRKKSSNGSAGGSWMDTYGDMVTLLLTFFVMLYASSSIDEAKWQYILQAFTSEGKIVNPIVADDKTEEESDEPYITNELDEGELPQSFDQLYQYLVNYVETNNLQDSVEVEKGASNVYLKFRDHIFFNGDSAVLLPAGQEVLASIGEGIHAVDDQILLIKVSGHTAEAQYSTMDDTNLSADRAVNVVNFLEEIEVTTADLVSSGYGKSRPVAPNDTAENMAKNRRVEIVIMRKDADYSDPAVIQEFIDMELGVDYVPGETSNKNDSSETD